MRVQSHRLEQFHRQIDGENVNLAAAEALKAVQPLPAPQRRRQATIALVASPELYQDFENNAHVVKLARADWENQLSGRRPDFVLVETDFHCDGGWRDDLFSSSRADNQLLGLAAHCAALSIPCGLWITLQGDQLDLLAHLLDAFEALFVAEPEAFLRLRARYGDRKVKRAPPCVDVSTFNPARAVCEGDAALTGALPAVADCLGAVMYHDQDGELLGALQNMLAYNVLLYDSREFLRPRESYMPAHLLRRSLGSLGKEAARGVLKIAEVSILLESARDRSYWRQHRKILQALASKSLAISDQMDCALFGEDLASIAQRYLRAESLDALPEMLDALLSRRFLRERLAQIFFRRVATAHDVGARIREMQTTFGLVPDAPEQPKVSVLLPTNRPENFAFALARYRAQGYANKELVVILNTGDAMTEPLRRQLCESDDARILGIPARWPIGVCLNAAIAQAQGEFWAKFDDDDIYGPAYLSDFVLNASFVDFDIAGKVHIFTYDERADRTVLRRTSDPPHTQTSAFAGGTLFAKTRPDDLLFAENSRGLVDITFQWRHLAEGRLLYASDPFNFMQIRRADRRTHTWRVEVAEMGEADFVAPGVALEAVLA